MKKLKKLTKTIVIIFLSLCISIPLAGVGFYYATTSGATLNTEKLKLTSSTSSLKIFDINGNQIKPSAENYISIKKLSANTKNAFICAEDKRFYTHSGLDFIRIGGAIISNLKSKSFSQGGSTISQQLVKNTQLSNEKTISRKLKEFKLTKQLEQKYSKDQILELYLNNIYFGNGAYGIENASMHYFNKSSTMLTLAESALLAATINAPSIYDIENKPENAIKRRNLILDLMQSYGKIDKNECKVAKAEPVSLNITKLSNNNYLFNQIIKEASSLTKQSENMLKNSGLKIYTNIDLSLQNKISQTIKNKYSNLESNPEIACMIINNDSNQITAIVGSNNVLSSNIQAGSALKPLLVYAPAIEHDIIYPATKILDEPINISGYTPNNADKKFHGHVSVRESLSKSYNIPAVKLLQELGISKSQNFAKKLGLTFTENDNNLSTALGSLSNGISLKTLADAYCSFANSGNFKPSTYISKITKDDKLIYQNQNTKSRVMKDSTAYLITDMLKTTASSGTAKRLNNLPFEIASKTGTAGMPNSSKNLSAINVSYTTKHTIICYFGNKPMPEQINGSTHPTMLAKDILSELYKTPPPAFQKPSSVVVKNLDKTDYNKNIVSTTTETENSIKEVFSKSNTPQNKTNSHSLVLDVFNFENKKPILCFFTSKNHTYQIIRKENDKDTILAELKNINFSKIAKFEDKTAKSGHIYEYFVKIYENSINKQFQTNHVKLKSF